MTSELQILTTNTIRNVWEQVWRSCMLTSRFIHLSPSYYNKTVWEPVWRSYILISGYKDHTCAPLTVNKRFKLFCEFKLLYFYISTVCYLAARVSVGGLLCSWYRLFYVLMAALIIHKVKTRHDSNLNSQWYYRKIVYTASEDRLKFHDLCTGWWVKRRKQSTQCKIAQMSRLEDAIPRSMLFFDSQLTREFLLSYENLLDEPHIN